MSRIKSLKRISNKKRISNNQCRILILGTMPGKESLDKQEYYADKRNQFWEIMSQLFNSVPPTTREEKESFLLSEGIALWDVIDECSRSGSSDRELKDIKANEFEWLNETGIAYIAFNGQRAAQLFAKHVGLEKIRNVRYVLLPSTSGAHSLPLELKVEIWKTVLESLLSNRNLLR